MTTTLIDTPHALTEEGAPRVRFAARERRGVLLGLTFPQLVVIAAVIAVLLGVLFVDPDAFWFALPVAAAALFFTLATYRREPIVLIGAQAARYGLRALSHQTVFRRDVWMRVATASLQVGQAHLDATAPTVVSRFVLPGALGDVQLVQIPGAGGFAYNAHGHLASVTLEVSSRAWALRDRGTQQGAYDGFVEWLSSLENIPGLSEATARVRVDRASSTALHDYLTSRHAQLRPAVSEELVTEYSRLTEQAAKRSMGFANHLTLTFDTTALGPAIRDAGHGLRGLAAVLKDRVEGMDPAMGNARLAVRGWLTADQLEEALADACDPVAATTRRESADSDETVPPPTPVMGIDEGWDTLHVDTSWHQTLWVAEWPRTDVRTGFLEPLLYAGDSTRVITLQVRPIPIHKALAEVNRAQADMETAAAIRTRLQSRISLTHQREADDLASREADLVDGYGDVQFRGFVTVSAETPDALAKARSEIEQASHPARLLLASMSGQQAAAFVTSALPLPTQGR